ncbi:MAG: GNAT family N-acetyltransferase [Pseudomonadota bacterium]|nr:GNAT family N-acetyltransferase [Pseudomonadota bacterium]
MELETRRLLLRPLSDDDAHAMALALNNLNVSRNLARVKFPYMLEDAQAFISLQRSFDPCSKICAITFRCAPDELIGMVSYEYGTNGDNANFGYWLRECCWGMRLMSEAAAALVAYAFANGQVETLNSAFHTDNPKSGRILSRLGFVETHQEANFSLAQGKSVPTIQLCLTAEAWFTQQKGRAA